MVRIAAVAAFYSALAGVSRAAVFEKADYDSGAVHHRIMEMKVKQWDAQIASGQMNSFQYPELGYTKCENGFAAAIPGDFNSTFRCNNVDLYHFLSHADLGSKEGQGSSSWGWTSADGREFVAIGQFDGTAFAEITSEGKLSYLGRLPQFDSIGSRWREIRVVKDIMVVGSEAIEHGIQFFDMKKLLDLDPASPKTFTQEELTGHWDELPVGRTHNVVVNEELGYAIACGSVGGNETIRVRPNDLPCKGGLIYLDISDPTKPFSPGCAAGDGYVHDAECLVYRGPDKRYEGRDICYGYNEDTLTIYDVTDKNGNVTNIISIVSFPGAEYIHQGAVLDKMNQEYLLLDDEFDERDADVGPMTRGLPTTHIFDIRDLENPVYTGNFAHRTRGIDHNQYVFDGFVYQSNYGNGLNVWDVSSIPSDPTGGSVCEAGFIDIYPEDDENEGSGSVAFLGSWSHYAGFKSGFIFVHTIERGSFVVKMTDKACPKPKTCSADNCMRALRASHIPGRLEASTDFCHDFLTRQYMDTAGVPSYAVDACGGAAAAPPPPVEDDDDTCPDDNAPPAPTQAPVVVSRVSSACACIPTKPVPELPRTTSRPPVPTVLPDRR
ncbi:hypothetical protein MCOR27_010753 [Pyricularia oryzae]|uniref:Uncharacterized protein n=2 Tax=Pyricularia TaxID=48558 RepID=A0ABQ8N864_PYRGI|nr:hypothetical protein MCOR01_000283 [Pyricularia oryzae]KAI6291539.1 hypothetical protein MCOR33_010545 [Pyricularia grisea]KAH9428001.1 hypothetical protein MCOR02_011493 [Pyricularia oryzae]KAI6254484.1 hypothetical protein MCOR19_009010 [Pyricularia oryzae]KAI6266585.1 hypothetical protein MCOR26_010105 [Pyricularia oryzae]